MLPIVRFLKKKELKFNHASIGQTRVEYFRLDEYQAIIKKHQ